MKLSLLGIIHAEKITVDVLIDSKPYKYLIESEYALRVFEKLLRREHYGKALEVLKKFSETKGEPHTEQNRD